MVALTKRDITHNINFFMNVPITSDGGLTFADGISAPGRYVELQAERPISPHLQLPQLNNPYCLQSYAHSITHLGQALCHNASPSQQMTASRHHALLREVLTDSDIVVGGRPLWARTIDCAFKGNGDLITTCEHSLYNAYGEVVREYPAPATDLQWELLDEMYPLAQALHDDCLLITTCHLCTW